jgi:hypothetical protein
MLALKVVATDSSCGLLQPIRVICGKVNTPLIPWNDMGLSWYSGRALYTKTVVIPTGYLQKDIRLMLDPGQVNYFAEIWVNGKLVTFHPWAPFETEITGFVKEGENSITMVVANLAANKATWNILDDNVKNKDARWWHDGSIRREKEMLVSGLLGPVQIIPYCYESVEFSVK